jgi:hypothetical protein
MTVKEGKEESKKAKVKSKKGVVSEILAGGSHKDTKARRIVCSLWFVVCSFVLTAEGTKEYAQRAQRE